LYALAYDSSRRYIGYRNIGDGDIRSSRADIRKLSAFVLECKATGIILAHNHPHGIALPSQEDIDCTKYIYKILDALKVRLLDHIIVNESDYISMAETMRYTYIFSGIEQSPFEKEFNEELEKAREAVENNERRKNAEKVRKMLEKINKSKEDNEKK
jgi:DNA repair protein RadC